MVCLAFDGGSATRETVDRFEMDWRGDAARDEWCAGGIQENDSNSDKQTMIGDMWGLDPSGFSLHTLIWIIIITDH